MQREEVVEFGAAVSGDIAVAFVHFRTTTLDHLDAAWFSLAQQTTWDGVREVIVLDNNTEDDPDAIWQVLRRYPVPVPVRLHSVKHGDRTRTHSWSVNACLSLISDALWVWFTRTDFLLDPTCLSRFLQVRDTQLMHSPQWSGLVTSWCHQMGYDAALSNTDALAPHSCPDAAWRRHPDGPRSLIGTVPACHFHDADKDAGVWLTRHALWQASGGLNERMHSWGFQQQVWQRRLLRLGAEIIQIPEYLFHHQHHAAPRDFAQAAAELRYSGE